MLKLTFIGILAAIALPDYSKLRDRAETGARVAEAIGLAKECALAAASNLDEDVTGSANVIGHLEKLNCSCIVRDLGYNLYNLK